MGRPRLWLSALNSRPRSGSFSPKAGTRQVWKARGGCGTPPSFKEPITLENVNFSSLNPWALQVCLVPSEERALPGVAVPLGGELGPYPMAVSASGSHHWSGSVTTNMERQSTRHPGNWGMLTRNLGRPPELHKGRPPRAVAPRAKCQWRTDC